MKRIIYGVGFFLVVLFLSAGFLLSYQVTELKDRMYALEESSAAAQQQVSSLADAKGKNLIFERYEEGSLKKEQYRITAYGTERIVLRQENPEAAETTGKEQGFQLKLKDGYVVVYDKASGEIFEETNIPLEALPEHLRTEILLGKEIENQKQLYSFLENYSS